MTADVLNGTIKVSRLLARDANGPWMEQDWKLIAKNVKYERVVGIIQNKMKYEW